MTHLPKLRDSCSLTDHYTLRTVIDPDASKGYTAIGVESQREVGERVRRPPLDSNSPLRHRPDR